MSTQYIGVLLDGVEMHRVKKSGLPLLFLLINVAPLIGATISVAPGTDLGGTAGRPFKGSFLVAAGIVSGPCAVTGIRDLECYSSGNVLTVSGTVEAEQAEAYEATLSISVPTDTGMAWKVYSFYVSMPLAVHPETRTEITAIVGAEFKFDVSLKRGTGTYPYSTTISAGPIPIGTVATFTESGGARVAGVLLVSGTYSYTVTIIDRWGSRADHTLRIVVSEYEATVIVSPPPPDGSVGGSYYHQLYSSGPSPFRWSITSGALPQGLFLRPSSGELTGVPTQAGFSTFTVSVTDSNPHPRTVQRTITITIRPASTLVITRPVLPLAFVGTRYSVDLTAAGGVPPYRWEGANLPAGISVTTTGILNGIAETEGSAVIVLTVRDAAGVTQTTSPTFSVLKPIAVTRLPNGTVGEQYEISYGRGYVPLPLPAGFGSILEDWWIHSGTLPRGLTLSRGHLRGTPQESGHFQFVAQHGFLEERGLLLPYFITVDPAAGVVPYSIADGTSLLLSTNSTDTAPRVGHGYLEPDYLNAMPSALTLLEVRRDGMVSEAVVPAADFIRNGRIFGEVSASVNTGIVFSNPGSSQVLVEFLFRDANGEAILKDRKCTSFEIPPYAIVSVFLNEPPLCGPSEFVGTLAFRSNSSLGVTALRWRTDEQLGFSLTAVPVIPEIPRLGTDIVPQFAAGAGWTTEFVLVNSTSVELRGKVQFLDSGSGAIPAQEVALVLNGIAAPALDYVLPPFAVRRIVASAGGDNLRVGSARIEPSEYSFLPASILMYSFHSGGTTLFETASSPGQPSESHRLFVANQANPRIRSAVAITNPSPNSITANLALMDTSGSVIGRATLDIPANGQVAR